MTRKLAKVAKAAMSVLASCGRPMSQASSARYASLFLAALIVAPIGCAETVDRGDDGPAVTYNDTTEVDTEPVVLVQGVYYRWHENVKVWVHVNEPPTGVVVQPLSRLPARPLVIPQHPTAIGHVKPTEPAANGFKTLARGPMIRPTPPVRAPNANASALKLQPPKPSAFKPLALPRPQPRYR